VGIEARGFILGGANCAQLLGGVRMDCAIRKRASCPGRTHLSDYKLEYGEAIVELHEGRESKPGEKVLSSMICSPLAAPRGGDPKLIQRLGGEIASCAFIPFDLPELGGLSGWKPWGMEVQRALRIFDGA